MARIGKTLAVVISTVLVAGLGAQASADNPADKIVTGHHSSVTSIATKPTQLERDKAETITRVQQGIDKANENIDALAKMSEGEKGFAKERLHHMQKAITCLRDLLSEDRNAVTSSSADEWKDVRPMVESDLAGASGEARLAYVVINPPQRPATGVTNKQPRTK